ncbi:Uncharacterised protein [Raoultella terrigena]|uniref:Uncharacterized protein n=1 Tax=Raoultella terrigena TaxID=577 RepID=A0A4U9D177_RAOTE|nr:Uncharacterised protein [Raoultella terrigena]
MRTQLLRPAGPRLRYRYRDLKGHAFSDIGDNLAIGRFAFFLKLSSRQISLSSAPPRLNASSSGSGWIRLLTLYCNVKGRCPPLSSMLCIMWIIDASRGRWAVSAFIRIGSAPKALRLPHVSGKAKSFKYFVIFRVISHLRRIKDNAETVFAVMTKKRLSICTRSSAT